MAKDDHGWLNPELPKSKAWTAFHMAPEPGNGAQ